jgi:hypothetical protein
VIALLLGALNSPAHAAFRTPQVAVSGSALQSFFTAQGQLISVASAQLDAQSFSLAFGAAFEVLPILDPTASIGAYNASAASPPLYAIYPGAASPGWTAFASFRDLPARMVVNLFDQNNAVQGTNTYVGADNTDFGFYALLPGGLAYSQDSRNAGGYAQMLAFAGTGVRAGSTWLAFESTPGPGGDFADAVALVTLTLAPVPATNSSWGRVKALYRR